MGNLINEAFKVSRSNDLRQNPIAFIDPNIPENAKSFDYKDIIKNSGAKWSKSPQFKNVFPPHKTGFWFWYIGKTKDKWQISYDRMIKPALEKIHQMEGADEGDSKASLIASIDAILEKITSAQPSFDSDRILSKEEKEAIKDKLEDFKQVVINIKDDAQFKETMQKVLAFKNAQGHEFSFLNSILILIQNPNAKVVKSKTNWSNLYNRLINKDATPIWIRKPSERSKRKYSKNEKDDLTQKFLKDTGKKDISQLGVGERERLNTMLSGQVMFLSLELYDVYDVADTTLMEGKEDPVQDLLKREEIPWFTGDEIDDKVRPVYDALINYADTHGIGVDLVGTEVLGGARGSSAGGRIKLLKNEGNDVGITKTLAHEITHELLHQRYLKGKNKEMEKYFIGTEIGRGLVEQQAELTAWMVLNAFGFDLKTTSFNYAALWGADEKSMIDVFNNVINVANHLISEIAMRGNKLAEGEPDIPLGKKRYEPMDVAKILGVEDKFREVLRNDEKQQQMMERYIKLINKK